MGAKQWAVVDGEKRHQALGTERQVNGDPTAGEREAIERRQLDLDDVGSKANVPRTARTSVHARAHQETAPVSVSVPRD